MGLNLVNTLNLEWARSSRVWCLLRYDLLKAYTWDVCQHYILWLASPPGSSAQSPGYHSKSSVRGTVLLLPLTQAVVVFCGFYPIVGTGEKQSLDVNL